MQRFLLVFLAVIGAISILLFFGGLFVLVIGAAAWSDGQRGIPAGTVLEIQFEQKVVETVPDDPIARLFTEESLVLRDLVDAIDQARDDDRVVALVARVSGIGMGFAQLQEVRDALLRFEESGKPMIAFAETFGELSPGNTSYYLATAFDRIYLQPSGDLNLTGLYLESTFLRGTLEKLGIDPQIDKRWEYKNAADTYLQKEFTEAHRQSSQHLIEGLFGQIVSGIAEARELSPSEVEAWIDRGPLLASTAKEAGFVDELRYYDEVLAEVAAAGGAEYLDPHAYIERAGRPHEGSATLALVHGYGGIQRGESSYDGFGGEPICGAETVARALRDAADSDRVAAIVFRVNSPGGSYVASDAVRREVVRAKEMGKPIVVSMGDYAASGGYFVSMAADAIVAQPGTLTGSIGVYGGKLALGGLMDKLGVSFDQVSTSTNAGIFSTNRPYTETEWTRIEGFLDRVYEDFTSKVAADRDLPLERVQEIARGRVWTGADAVELGLVDEIGGLDRAARKALELAGEDPSAGYRFRPFPGPKSTWELLAETLEERSAVRALALQLRSEFAPLLALAGELGLTPSPEGVLHAPGPRVGGLGPRER